MRGGLELLFETRVVNIMVTMHCTTRLTIQSNKTIDNKCESEAFSEAMTCGERRSQQ